MNSVRQLFARLCPICKFVALGALLSILAACADIRYYAHVTRGEGALLTARRPVAAVVADPATPSALAARLKLSQQARVFASARLGLPDNRSYTYYVDLHRPYVVWNVYATPRFSVDAVPQCFPVAGCVAYRGWFDEDKARADAMRLRAAGYDVYASGVPAYSTLGWFADPILSSMLRWDDDELVGTIFHELAHQLIYVKGDTAFNESYATFVQDEGLREWLRSRGLPDADDNNGQVMDDQFTQLVLDLRDRLKTLYASNLPADAMALAKEKQIAAFRVQYATWRQQHWPDNHNYDAWVAAPINNARLLPFGLYDQWTPAFATLFERSHRSWPLFYAAVRALATQAPGQRHDALQSMMQKSATVAQPAAVTMTR